MERPPTPAGEAANAGAVVRRVRAEEWSRLRDLRLAALRDAPAAFASLLEEEMPRPEAHWRRRAEEGASARDTGTWIAEAADGRWLGLASLTNAEGEFHLQSLWVAPEARRAGIARRLVAAALELVERHRPTEPVHLEVNPRMTDAVRLYRSFGFVETGRVRPLREGSDESRMAMVWTLSPGRR